MSYLKIYLLALNTLILATQIWAAFNETDGKKVLSYYMNTFLLLIPLYVYLLN